MQAWSDAQRRHGKLIAFVPTMGALHEGHLSLVDRARERGDVVVASIFINPKQFGPGEDFAKYPRTLEHDCALLERRGVDVAFTPTVVEVYPPGHATQVSVLSLTERLEGATRPTHFAGVTLVVAKLLLAVKPHVAVFGRKDAQQALVVRRMTEDLRFGITIDIAPTAREPDGLAMSSRNAYLSPEERRKAVVLSRALRTGFDLWADGERNAARLVQSMRKVLDDEPDVRLDYLATVNQDTLEPVETVGCGALVAGAVHVGRTRLIDNWWVTPDGKGEF